MCEVECRACVHSFASPQALAPLGSVMMDTSVCGAEASDAPTSKEEAPFGMNVSGVAGGATSRNDGQQQGPSPCPFVVRFEESQCRSTYLLKRVAGAGGGGGRCSNTSAGLAFCVNRVLSNTALVFAFCFRRARQSQIRLRGSTVNT